MRSQRIDSLKARCLALSLLRAAVIFCVVGEPAQGDDLVSEEFKMAMRAFDLFTLAERTKALEEFARLRYPSLQGRFVEAVYRVIVAE